MDEAKRALLETIEREQRRLERLVERLPSPQFEKPIFDPEGGDEAWTLMDVLAHLTLWKRAALRVAEAQRAEGAPLEDRIPAAILGLDVQGENERLRSETRGRQFGELLAEQRAVHDALVAALRELPAERLLREPRPTEWRSWLSPAVSHYQLHRAHVIDALGLLEPPVVA